MNEQPSNENRKLNPLVQQRTIEDEASRDIGSAIFFKYFVVLIGAIFAILLAKPETASGTFVVPAIPLRYAIYYYSLIGFFGLMFYEFLVMTAKKQRSQLKIPVYSIILFSIYATIGFFIFLKLFSHLLGIDEQVITSLS